MDRTATSEPSLGWTDAGSGPGEVELTPHEPSSRRHGVNPVHEVRRPRPLSQALDIRRSTATASSFQRRHRGPQLQQVRRPDRSRPRPRRRVRVGRRRPPCRRIRLGERRTQLQQMHEPDPASPRLPGSHPSQANRGSPAVARRASMRVRSSVKWTALTRVSPGTSGSSVNDPVAAAVTVTLNVREHAQAEGSVAVTVAVAVPAATGVTVTVLPKAAVARTAAADDPPERPAPARPLPRDRRARSPHVQPDRARAGGTPRGAAPESACDSGVHRRRRRHQPAAGATASPQVGGTASCPCSSVVPPARRWVSKTPIRPRQSSLSRAPLPHSSARIACRSSITCTALMAVTPAVIAASAYCGRGLPAASCTASRASRSSTR